MGTTAPQDNQTADPLSLLSHEEAQLWIDSFVVKCEETLSVETIDTYRRKLKLFMEWWGASSPNRAMTTQLAYAYGNYRTGLPGSVRSHALHLAVVKRWGSYLVTAGRLSHNPWISVVAPRQPVWLATDWLTFPEIKRLLQSFDRTSRSQQRDAIIARLMLKTAAREHELAMADIKDIRLIGTEAWLFLKSKGKRKEEPVLLMKPLKDEIDAYLLRRYPDGIFPPDSPLFTVSTDDEERRIPTREMRRRITNALKRAHITRAGITPLSLRHTAGKQALAKKAPLPAVQEMMRHESIKTTRRLAEQEHRKSFPAERFLTHY